jgi:hypothetical protein
MRFMLLTSARTNFTTSPSALSQHIAAHRDGITHHRQAKSLHVEDGLEPGFFQHQRIGRIDDRCRNPAILERQYPVVLSAHRRHLNIALGIHAEPLQREAKVKVRDVVNPRATGHFSFELLDLVDPGLYFDWAPTKTQQSWGKLTCNMWMVWIQTI